MPGTTSAPGDFEGAFLPCTFWLATAYALTECLERAEAILSRIEEIAGPLGLLAEEVDPRTGTLLGNTPLLFAHAEYLKAVLSLAMARPVDASLLIVGRAARWIRHWGTRG